MKFVFKMLVAFVVLMGVGSANLFAGDNKDPIFVNMISDDPHGTIMALHFSTKMLNKGHPISILINNKGINVILKSNKKYAEQQKMIEVLVNKGATVLYCPMCLEALKKKEADVISGVKESSPDLMEQALFKDNTKTMTW